MNCTPFVASFFRSTINSRWTQYKYCHKSATLILWFWFKTFFWKNLENSQASIDNIKVSLDKTPNTNWKKSKIGHLIYNIFNLS